LAIAAGPISTSEVDGARSFGGAPASEANARWHRSKTSYSQRVGRILDTPYQPSPEPHPSYTLQMKLSKSFMRCAGRFFAIEFDREKKPTDWAWKLPAVALKIPPNDNRLNH
jgi:hypothetical protein